jgi:two-component system response regulator CpxR
MTTTPRTSSRVLIIDDDEEFCSLIAEYLADHGYQVEAAHTGPDGIARSADHDWHAIILDVMLPSCDGFEVLRGIRGKSQVPVLMLTARGEEDDQIAGLEGGADDYLPKGSSTRNLLARLHAITRRAQSNRSEERAELVIGDNVITHVSRTVTLAGETLSLTSGEYQILHTLALAKGKVKSRDELMEEIRDREWQAFDRSLDVHVSNLRKKLKDDPKEPRYIRTVRGVGYMMGET